MSALQKRGNTLRETRVTVVLILLAIFAMQVTGAEVQDPVLRGVRAVVPPVIDGSLDDPCWRQCTPASDFHMVEPIPGSPVTQPTLVYVAYDDERLYFGIHMSESEPDRLQAAANQRDGTVYMDDSFEVILDTFCDRRNAYYFMSNLISAKLDGRIIDEGRNIDETWDGHWETKAQLVDDGWEMEIAIPFSELNFSLEDSLTWGINFWRVERPHWESSSWAPVQRWCQVSKYGTLTGIRVRPKVRRFELLPYAAARFEEDSLHPKGGIDLEYDLPSDLIVNATLLPDFAQIEADPFRFNLSYQEGEELFFPEKRPFFLEGGAILTTPLRLFYTRRMNEILAGAKVYGKVGSTELLALDVQTEDTEENFSVLRVKQELPGTPTLGALVTHKQRSDTFSQAAGVDFNLPIRGPFLLTSQLTASRNTGVSGDAWAGYLGIEGETGDYGAGVVAGRVGPHFQVEQGYIPAYDIDREGISGWAWGKPVQERGWFQWVDAGVSFDLAREIGDRLARGDAEFWMNFVSRPKWRLGITGERNYERYGDEEYVNRNLGLQIESNVGGMTGVSASYSFGSLYDSHVRSFHFGFLVLPVERLSVFPVLQAIRLGEGRWQWITNTRVSYQMTDKMFVRAFVRTESESGTTREYPFEAEGVRNLYANLLLGYEFGPGTIFYLVYNQLRDLDTDSVDHIVVAKFTCSLRF